LNLWLATKHLFFKGADGLMTGEGSSARIAILLVNGFDRRGQWGQYNEAEAIDYPWIALCLRQIERNSKGRDYEVFVFDNSHLKVHEDLMRQYEHVRVLPGRWFARLGRFAGRVYVGRFVELAHPRALDYLVGRVAPDFDYVITLDTDSFPVRDDWLDVLINACEDGAAVVGVYRDEMAPSIRPFIHVSGLCVRRRDLCALRVSFARRRSQDVGQNITEEFRRLGRKIVPLERSNRVNYHFLVGGIYGDVIYHHGAGSRNAEFWTSTDCDADELVSTALRDAAFRDLDHLIAVLRGDVVNDLGLKPTGSMPQEAHGRRRAEKS
jgi:hypothetical protein